MLLERDGVLAAGDALLRGGPDDPSVLVVLGAAGVGTSAIVDQVLRRARPTMTVALARCLPSDEDRPRSMVQRLAAQVGPVPKQGWTPDDGWGGVRLDLAKRLRWATVVQPVLVTLEDAHHCDSDSLEVLADVVEHGPDLRMAVLVSGARTPAVVRLVDRLAASASVAVHELGPLSEAATRALVADHLGPELAAEVGDDVWALAQGNPALIGLLVERIRSDGPTSVLGSRRERPVPAALPPSCRPAAEAAAVLGDEFRLGLVAAVADLDPSAANDALDQLFALGLLHSTGRGRATLDGEMAAGLRAALSPARGAELHRRAFLQERALGHTTEAAGHAIAADLVGDPDAVDIVSQAAMLALAAGAVQTASHLATAAAHLGGTDVPVAILQLDGDALLAAGNPSEAARRFERALRRDDLTVAERVGLLRRQAQALAYGGDLAGSQAVSLEAWELCHLVQPELAVEVVVEHVHAVWQANGPAAARSVVEEYTAGGNLPDHPAVGIMVGYLRLWWEGDRGTLADELVELAAAMPPPLSTPFDPVLCLSSALRFADRFAEDDRLLRSALEAAEQDGRSYAVATLDISLADSLIRRGRPDLAIERLDTLRRATSAPIMRGAVDTSLASAALEQGDAVALEHHLGDVPEVQYQWAAGLWLRHFRAGALLLRGDAEEASRAYAEVARVAWAAGVRGPVACSWAEWAIAAHLDAAALDEAERVIEWLEGAAIGSPGGGPHVVAEAARAGVAALRGDREEAARRYKQAGELDAPPLVTARALLASGEFQLAEGAVVEARELFRRALATFERAGAVGFVHRCTVDLHRAGGRRSSRRRPTSAAVGLTDQERRVAQLAADGLLNREIAEALFISPKTVETHLSRAFDKLGVRSRRALRGRTFIEE